MARDPRLIDNPTGLVEITSRTLQGLFLLLPSAEVNDLILGVLGRAQTKYNVVLHAFCFMSNHFHLLASILGVDVMSLFVGYLKTNIAKEVGAVHDWEENFWGRRYHSASPSVAEHDQAARFRYILSNGCKEKLVASPLDWPGVSSAGALYRGETTMQGTWNDRTAQYRSGGRKLFPSIETVHLTPLPFLQERSADEQRAYVVQTVHEIELETAEMHKQDGTRPMGADAVRRRNPYDKPLDFKTSRAPVIHAANPEDFWTMYKARKAKIEAYRVAAARLKQGETDVSFPEDCFPPRLPFVKARAPT